MQDPPPTQDPDEELEVHPSENTSSSGTKGRSAPAPKRKTFKLNVPLKTAIPGYKGGPKVAKKRKKEGGKKRGIVSKKEKGKRKAAAKRGGQ